MARELAPAGLRSSPIHKPPIPQANTKATPPCSIAYAYVRIRRHVCWGDGPNASNETLLINSFETFTSVSTLLLDRSEDLHGKHVNAARYA